jgi:hypothetical protein
VGRLKTCTPPPKSMHLLFNYKGLIIFTLGLKSSSHYKKESGSPMETSELLGFRLRVLQRVGDRAFISAANDIWWLDSEAFLLAIDLQM